MSREPPPTEALHGTRVISEALRVSQRTVLSWLHTGKLHGIQPGGPDGHWRIPDAEFQRILLERGLGQPSDPNTDGVF